MNVKRKQKCNIYRYSAPTLRQNSRRQVIACAHVIQTRSLRLSKLWRHRKLRWQLQTGATLRQTCESHKQGENWHSAVWNGGKPEQAVCYVRRWSFLTIQCRAKPSNMVSSSCKAAKRHSKIICTWSCWHDCAYPGSESSREGFPQHVTSSQHQQPCGRRAARGQGSAWRGASDLVWQGRSSALQVRTLHTLACRLRRCPTSSCKTKNLSQLFKSESMRRHMVRDWPDLGEHSVRETRLREDRPRLVRVETSSLGSVVAVEDLRVLQLAAVRHRPLAAARAWKHKMIKTLTNRSFTLHNDIDESFLTRSWCSRMNRVRW